MEEKTRFDLVKPQLNVKFTFHTLDGRENKIRPGQASIECCRQCSAPQCSPPPVVKSNCLYRQRKISWCLLGPLVVHLLRATSGIGEGLSAARVGSFLLLPRLLLLRWLLITNCSLRILRGFSDLLN